jgi:hypothetical protein
MCKEKCHKGKNPKECTPEQIKECHGDVKEHPCEETEDKKKTEDK